MKFTILTLFPGIIEAYFSESIMARAVQRELIQWRVINIRDFAFDKHKSCDDAPYGGGAGMLLLAPPLGSALESCGVKRKEAGKMREGPPVVYLSPSGGLFNQEKAAAFAKEEELILICGRYEGIDQRIVELYVDEELSVGDYVLSSGELAALSVIDSVYRLVDSVIAGESLKEESFESSLLEYPQWTRPEIYDSLKVPDVLLSGHHERIRRWRLERRVERTLQNRPDLLEKGIKTGVFNRETLNIIEMLETKL